MVVSWSDVCDDRSQGVERSLVTVGYLTVHILLYLVHRHMSGTFDECLYVLCPGTCYQLAHRIEFGKLCLVVSVGYTSGAQTVAERESDVILRHDVADVVEVFVEE